MTISDSMTKSVKIILGWWWLKSLSAVLGLKDEPSFFSFFKEKHYSGISVLEGFPGKLVYIIVKSLYSGKSEHLIPPSVFLPILSPSLALFATFVLFFPLFNTTLDVLNHALPRSSVKTDHRSESRSSMISNYRKP